MASLIRLGEFEAIFLGDQLHSLDMHLQRGSGGAGGLAGLGLGSYRLRYLVA
ncbi:hypothetical protein [Pseudomonas brassicacearum]|uniref:hypothetical protein n=1 Tax=Pseudomonas brassicacearum TaxID=930166 RepID=UPI00160AE77E|nr:hypothetical protein [Pseudomonas brassicacearum]